MRILFTSDLHGDKEAFKFFTSQLDKHYDIGIISGDLLDDSITLDEMRDTLDLEDDDLLEELYDPEDTIEDLDRRVRDYKADPDSLLSRTLQAKEDEYRQILSGTKKPILVIQGNHDRSKWETGGNIININKTRHEIGKYNFVGFKYTRLETTEEDERRHLKDLESLVDKNTIFVSHSPVYGILDRTRSGRSIGSRLIKEFLRNRNIVCHLFGHVHQSFGVQNTSFNGAYADNQKMMGIKLPTMKFSIIEKVKTKKIKKQCSRCNRMTHFNHPYCLARYNEVDPEGYPPDCPYYEKRRNAEGESVHEIMAREG